MIDERCALAGGCVLDLADKDGVIATVISVLQATLDACESVDQYGNSIDARAKRDRVKFIHRRCRKLLRDVLMRRP